MCSTEVKIESFSRETTPTPSSKHKFEGNARLVTKTPLLNGKTANLKKEEIRAYFNDTFDLYESLFNCLATEEAFYEKATPLRHPLIFYFGHTAVFFINKLNVAKLISARVDTHIESMLAIGVDEMSWDDMDETHYHWPSPLQVKIYRGKVRSLVNDFITENDLALPINWSNPFWIILMGIEHERIHLETSSVLIRQLPLKYVVPAPNFGECNERGEYDESPKNALHPVPARTITQGKDNDAKSFSWDNEYGSLTTVLPAFRASKYLVSNREFADFVSADGYRRKEFWSEEGQRWLAYTKAECPTFWRKVGSDLKAWRYRTMTREINMPWDWPADVNCLEAEAYCLWASKKSGKNIRLPAEAQWMALRESILEDQFDWELAPGNINLEHWASACPVNKFKSIMEDGTEFFDVIGNVWQWTETPITGLPGFKVHEAYDDFSTPTFDGKHNLMKGGSFFSTGNCATKDARYAFRRHFFQHAGFRYIESEDTIITELNPYETDEQVSQYIEFHFGETYFDVPNFAAKCGQNALRYFSQHSRNKPCRALDLGCAIGRTSLELASVFEHVDGVDFSARFISAATRLKETGSTRYKIKDEGEIFSFKDVTLETMGLNEWAHRCQFWQGDACNLPQKFLDYDLVFAGNLIDRLYEPGKFLEKIHTVVNPGGLLILTSPYTWLEEFTSREEWVGGFKRDGENLRTIDGLNDALSTHFDLVAEPADVPFVIRETARKFQHSIAQMTVWRRYV
ncbi:MAG: 5-histidylcysteine sulfoxide synthase [Gammaproteobacteria bacterium]|nr:5-histidylcysteine sulfoxide synthase [Gammaproteobacteria bacterium]